MPTETRILFVDDEPAYCRIFASKTKQLDNTTVVTANNGTDALTLLKSHPADIAFVDLSMPLMGGIELLTEIKRLYPDTFVVMLTSDDSTTHVVKAMKSGAYDYLLKPFDFDMIKHTINAIRAHKSAIRAGLCPECLTGESYCFENLIGQDRKMFEIYEMIQQVAQTTATVLVTGESGTGKELIAAAIHAKSNRKDKPFIQVNCAALTEGLISSELFGHEKGAFTGAISRKKGLFEQASGGTLFLDEIGDISLVTQVALLRVLELGTFQRVGGSETIKTDVRLICATNKDLNTAVREKLFREDLYYRLNVVSLHAPPLRERKSDIPLLARHFIERYASLNKKNISGVTQEAMEVLCAYDWPGNCRELANIIEHAVVFCRDTLIDQTTLPAHLQKAQAALSLPKTPASIPKPSQTLAEVESALIQNVLTEADWNLKKAAQMLDIARGTLYSKMEKYGIQKPA